MCAASARAEPSANTYFGASKSFRILTKDDACAGVEGKLPVMITNG